MGLGEGCASMGMQITLFVVPLLAVTQFGASPLQLGVLNLLDSAAALCFGLIIGTTVDRMGGFVAVAIAESVRFGAIGILAVSLILGPTLVSLYLAMFAVGAASLMREAGTSAAVVELGNRSSRFLNRMNALLRGGSVVSETTGPGVAGLLVLGFGLAGSLLGGALGFAVAGLCSLVVLRLRRPALQTAPSPVLVEAGSVSAMTVQQEDSLPSETPRSRPGMATGLRYIWHHPILRPLVLSSMQFNFFTAALQAVLVYYCVHQLGFAPAEFAVVGMSAGVGGLLGSLLAASSAVNGQQKAWYLSSLVVPAGAIIVIIAAQWQSHLAAVVLVSGAEFLWAAAIVLCVVLFNTLRQISSPDQLVGQIAASERMLAVAGEIPGALLGGLVGTFISLDLTMLAAMVGTGLSVLWAVRVPRW